MKCEYDTTVNRTICANFALRNAEKLGPFFEITMDVEFAAGTVYLERVKIRTIYFLSLLTCLYL